MSERPPSRIERIRRALGARAADGDWETGLRGWVETHDGASLATLAAELSDELENEVPIGVLETMREDSYRADPMVGRVRRVLAMRKPARKPGRKAARRRRAAA
jgi:hypothetical protein